MTQLFPKPRGAGSMVHFSMGAPGKGPRATWASSRCAAGRSSPPFPSALPLPPPTPCPSLGPQPHSCFSLSGYTSTSPTAHPAALCWSGNGPVVGPLDMEAEGREG